MHSPLPASTGASTEDLAAALAPLRVGALIALVLLSGWLVVALGDLGPDRQRALVLGIAVAVPVSLIFLARPLVGLGLYLVLLPLVYTDALVAGLNGGELLTAGVLALGFLTVTTAERRIWDGVTALWPILLPLAGLALISVVSMVANGVTELTGLVSAFLKILAFGLIALLVYLHAGTERKARLILLAILAGAFLEAVYSVGSYLMGLDYYAQYGYHRASGTFFTFNHLGAFMALLSVPTLALALGERGGWHRWPLLIGFVLEIVALLLSLTLGSVLGLLVAGFIAGVFLLRIPVRRIAAATGAFLLVFLTVLVLNPFLQDKVTQVGGRVMDRVVTYAVGVSMLSDRFWFGFGSQSRVIEALLSNLEYRITPFGVSSVVAHASVLSVGVEKGIFGVVFFVLLVAGALWLVLRDRRALAGSRYAILYQGLLVGALAFLVQDLTNNLLLHSRLGILFFTVVALIAAHGNLAREGARGAGEGSRRAVP